MNQLHTNLVGKKLRRGGNTYEILAAYLLPPNPQQQYSTTPLLSIRTMVVRDDGAIFNIDLPDTNYTMVME